jgi:hypothetical protein
MWHKREQERRSIIRRYIVTTAGIDVDEVVTLPMEENPEDDLVVESED